MRAPIMTDELIEQAQQTTDIETKKDTMHKASERLLIMQAQQELRKLRGKLEWDDDLDN